MHIPFVVNHTINATPPERLQQHPLFYFTTNHTDRTFFVWRLNSARPSHPGHSTIFLRSEIPCSMCAKLRTVAESNNRDHSTRSLSSSPLASTINCSPGSQALLEVTHQDHSIGITLSLLVSTTHIYFCSSRTSRWWWITQSMQRQCNCKHTMLNTLKLGQWEERYYPATQEQSAEMTLEATSISISR